ncbi:hypothetical protein DEU35_0670 [Microbacterium sp. AG157]|uniref:hypothetical protein n=1 Tax=Microbacterium sp. AG157 TaxID=2183993 RepID=UPI000E3ADF7F|nr:hypothetical protein [Microbacterium sp. AG157]REC99694.1 hypothetical protein DEU35_0670 [Microbacterium sp. AG157]
MEITLTNRGISTERPHMSRAHFFIAAAAVVATLSLAGCSSPQPGEAAPAPTAAVVATAAVTPAPTPDVASTAPISDIQAAADTFLGALDQLGIEHSEPVRAEVGASGAKARFDITVNGFEAGINVFPGANTLAAWGKLSGACGGIFVSSGNAVLSLNSSEGVGKSAEIAPTIADAVGGEARGV